jgi:hypothetical protein
VVLVAVVRAQIILIRVKLERRAHRGKETPEEREKRLMALLVAAVVEKAP